MRSSKLVHELSLTLDRRETLCIVGESGSGKTVTAMSLIRLLEFTAPAVLSGSVVLDGVDLVSLDPRGMREVRGAQIGMVFQEALDSLNPSHTIEAQLIEAYRVPSHTAGTRLRAEDRAEASQRARGLLQEVGLNDVDRVLAAYPHQLSGGMQQRVMIALALMGSPDVLIADEPTTALDVTTQAEILNLLRRLQRDHEMACIFITHDMAVASEIADRIAVMYAGRLVEIGATADILQRPKHRYTRELLRCVPRPSVTGRKKLAAIPGSVPAAGADLAGCRFAPRCEFASELCRTDEPELLNVDPGSRSAVACWHPGSGPVELELQEPGSNQRGRERSTQPVLRVTELVKEFKVGRKARRAGADPVKRAVDGVSLEIGEGEFFGLVGESGSGKTTLGRMVTALESPTSGSITIGDFTFGAGLIHRNERDFRRMVQPIFQDPKSSLDPRHSIERIIAEPLHELTELGGADIKRRVRELLDEVGLQESVLTRVPAELSGGQRQRVAIARAIACEPKLIVADEPTSALDVSVQGQVMNLLLRLREERGLSFLFITHNLSLVLSVADRIGVMKDGALVEVGAAAEIATSPKDPYTQRLLAANPTLPGDDAYSNHTP